MDFDNLQLSDEMVASLRAHPVNIVDVGAAGGVRERYLHELVRVIGFEPDPKAYAAALVNAPPNLTLLNEALWRDAAEKELFLTKSRLCSSMYRPNPAIVEEFKLDRFTVEEVATLKCRSMTDVLTDHGMQDVDFIKIDTQGSELEILKGGESILRRSVVGLDIEVEFLELYEGQPLFPEVHTYLNSLGFRLYQMKPHQFAPARANLYHGRSASKKRAPGYVAFVDARYWKPAAVIADMLAPRSRHGRLRKLHTALMSFALHANNDLIGPLLQAAGVRLENAPIRLAPARSKST